MDLTQVIVDFVRQSGLGTAIVVATGWFLVGKVWPWYTQECSDFPLQSGDIIGAYDTEQRGPVGVGTRR